MLINLSNHPLSTWSDKQLKSAKLQFKKVIDYAFPYVEPESNLEEVKSLAQNIVENIIKKYGSENIVIHIMGEHSLVYQLIKCFEQHKIICILSTTHRRVEKLSDGSKKVYFDFVRFRSYY